MAKLWRPVGFLVLQALVAAAVGVSVARSSKQAEESRALPSIRETPLRVTPRYDYPEVVSDEQLKIALTKLRPRFRRDKPKINHIDHALRFWGVEATFDDPDCLSGSEMRNLLLDSKAFSTAWGKNTPPLIYSRGAGLGVRTQEGNATASHVDHTLAGLAEVGTPLGFPIRTAQGSGIVRQILEQSLRDFSLNQTEYEWSTLAFALYLSPEQSWKTTEGQELTFDRLARRMMRQDLSRGVCFGNHRLYTLAALVQIDEEHPLLSADCRDEILAHLRGATDKLIQTQHTYGYWNRDWAGRSAKLVAGAESETAGDSISNRILATGHALEWWAIAPSELHPPRETLVRAGQWLCRTIDELDSKQIETNYTFLSHAGRSLALWRGKLPAECELNENIAREESAENPTEALK